MYKKLKCMAAVLAGAGALYALYKICISEDLKEMKEQNEKMNLWLKAAEDSNYTLAVLTDNKFLDNGTTECIYTYEVDGVEFEKVLTLPESERYPYAVVIYYDGENPARCVCEDEVFKNKENGAKARFA